MALTKIVAGSIADSELVNDNFQDLQDQITISAGLIAGINSTLQNIQSAITTMQNDIEDLKRRVTALEE